MTVDPTYVETEAYGGDPRDPFHRRMVGVARHGLVAFDVPYITHVENDLFVGGCATGLVLPLYIKHVVSLYPWERYTLDHELDSFLEFRMYDSEDQIFDQVEELADWVLARQVSGPTLIHCQAGLNRSNLIMARVLIKDGRTPEEAISFLREKRSPAVLCNSSFTRWLSEA